MNNCFFAPASVWFCDDEKFIFNVCGGGVICDDVGFGDGSGQCVWGWS